MTRFEIKDPKGEHGRSRWRFTLTPPLSTGLELSLYASLISLMDGLEDRVAQREVPSRPLLEGKKASSESVKLAKAAEEKGVRTCAC